MNKGFILLSLLLSILYSSCTKTLNSVSPTSTITTSSFWKTENDAEGALNGMYVLLRGVDEDIYTEGEERGEAWTGGVYGGASYPLYQNTMTPDAPGIPTWYGYYRVINSANLILKYVPDINFKSESAKKNILAQAHTMRAYIYFIMTKVWGNLVIRTEPTETTDPNVTEKERSAQADVFKLIKEDIDKALQLYPDNSLPDGRGEWSKPAANALKAAVYLWTGKKMNGGETDFETALSACNEVEKSDVELLSNFGDIFKFANKGNKEIIMSIKFNELEGSNFYWHMWIIGSAVPSNISQQAKDILLPVGGGQGIMVLTKAVRDQFILDDTRRNATFFEVYTHGATGDSTYFTNVFLKGKGEVTGGTRIFDSDFILFRYADVLLMKAEAKNALEQDPSIEINMVRKRAYGSNFSAHKFVSGSKEYNDEMILKERLLELVGEGKRWWDLVRFGKAFDLVPTLKDRKGQNGLLLFPIPTSTLSIEPKVKQNPDY